LAGYPGEHQLANTAFDHDNINLQRLDSEPVVKKKIVPKSFSQVSISCLA
jgi:hypothetical protein